MNTLAGLQMVRALLSDKARWCKGSVARGPEAGRLYLATSPEACSWCIIGAIHKIGAEQIALDPIGNMLLEACMLARWQLAAADLGYREAPNQINDQIGWEVVLKITDEAIRQEQAR